MSGGYGTGAFLAASAVFEATVSSGSGDPWFSQGPNRTTGDESFFGSGQNKEVGAPDGVIALLAGMSRSSASIQYYPLGLDLVASQSPFPPDDILNNIPTNRAAWPVAGTPGATTAEAAAMFGPMVIALGRHVATELALAGSGRLVAAVAERLFAAGYRLVRQGTRNILTRVINGRTITLTEQESRLVMEAYAAGRSARAITAPTNRGGLRTAMGNPPRGLANSQAHHDLPWDFRDWFAREGRGLNVNDPAFGRWVSGSPPGGHQAWSDAFNREWRSFINRNPDATRAQVIDFMLQLRNDPRFR